MTSEIRALRDKLRALEREYKDFDRAVRRSVDQFKDAITNDRKDFVDSIEERERTCFQALDGRLAHWRRDHQAMFAILDLEIEALQGAATAKPAAGQK